MLLYEKISVTIQILKKKGDFGKIYSVSLYLLFESIKIICEIFFESSMTNEIIGCTVSSGTLCILRSLMRMYIEDILYTIIIHPSLD